MSLPVIHSWQEFSSHMWEKLQEHDHLVGMKVQPIDDSRVQVKDTEYTLRILTKNPIVNADSTLHECVLTRSGLMGFTFDFAVLTVHGYDYAIWSTARVCDPGPRCPKENHWRQTAKGTVQGYGALEYGIRPSIKGRHVYRHFNAMKSISRITDMYPYGYKVKGDFREFLRILKLVDQALVRLAVHPRRDELFEIWNSCYMNSNIDTQDKHLEAQRARDMLIKVMGAKG